MIQFFHANGVIRPLVIETNLGYDAVAIIEYEGGEQRSSGPLGCFPSSNAAYNFAIDWALAKLDEQLLQSPASLSFVLGSDVETDKSRASLHAKST